ncbi:hypothetical protein OF117_19850 [Geodermatophilus sp. YIM 151500]|uniref:hypothetical protein n=1 Tax=Geodermatophilus sp. YIM 151500 TaxID=2984531 RepID=UPI0021E49D58|nr:hypothetical protein [Geodermatophilus sp. YIM 151500]MCV2491604.1 hypothetical protein [Geodermatophilus sp. YIM 151500]
MTAARRTLALVLLTMAIMVGAALPASAEFAAVRPGPQLGVDTYTVAPPTGVLVTKSQCYLTTTTREVKTTGLTTSVTITSRTEPTETVVFDETTATVGNTTTTTTRTTRLDVGLRWTASASKGVVGYAVVAHAPGASGAIDSTVGTTWNERVDARYLGYTPTLAVRTLTSYGWTADSAQTGALTC